VVSGRETTRVGSPHDGVLAEWLVHDGDPVRGGQVLARVEPEGALR
jgi:[acyl-carrier-protein] S-malonyltransferase